MRQITDIREMQQIALDILIYLDKVCEKYNLRYFIVDGTLLGAVRHKGFIPWDDDIDVWMPRKDYDRLAEIIEKDGSEYYKFYTPQNARKFIYPFGKLVDTRTGLIDDTTAKYEIGVHIDVFPCDGMPGNSEEEYRKYAKRCVFLAEQRYPAFTTWKQAKERKDKGRFYFTKWVLRKIIGGHNIVKIIDRYARKYPAEGAKYISSLASEYKYNQIMDASFCEELIDLEFEHHFFKAPKGYDEYLKTLYGDYMKLPPENERIAHARKAWWK